MIGTDKKMIGVNELPQGVADAAGIIVSNETTDKEEKFLQLASIAFNYRQSGVMSLHKEEVVLPPSQQEEKEYCSTASLQALKDVLSEESIPLLKLWLQHCQDKNKIAHPEIVPTLLGEGIQNKKLQSLITSCCGKRGEWLSRFNEAWNFSANQTEEEQWQTGSPEQRKSVLKELRITNPDKAREWLQQTWPQEDAATKQDFLELFSINISKEDIVFLESLQTDKSKKVKEAAMNLLKHIPESSIVQKYQQVLQQSVSLKKEKTMLGLSSKMVLFFQLPSEADENILKSGIELLSNKKEFSDDEYIIYQLIQSVPPSFWEQQLGLNPEEIIKQFQKDETGKKMIPALVMSVREFKDERWAAEFVQHNEVFYVDLIPLLSLQQQDTYSNKFMNEYPENIIQYALQRETEWGTELTKNIFKHTAKNIYQYSRNFYNQHIHLIPDKIAPELEKCTPSEEYARVTWSNASEYILKLLQLKSQIIQSFKV
mgnify:CR=1 FL=1